MKETGGGVDASGAAGRRVQDGEGAVGGGRGGGEGGRERGRERERTLIYYTLTLTY